MVRLVATFEFHCEERSGKRILNWRKIRVERQPVIAKQMIGKGHAWNHAERTKSTEHTRVHLWWQLPFKMRNNSAANVVLCKNLQILHDLSWELRATAVVSSHRCFGDNVFTSCNRCTRYTEHTIACWLMVAGCWLASVIRNMQKITTFWQNVYFCTRWMRGREKVQKQVREMVERSKKKISARERKQRKKSREIIMKEKLQSRKIALFLRCTLCVCMCVCCQS